MSHVASRIQGPPIQTAHYKEIAHYTVAGIKASARPMLALFTGLLLNLSIGEDILFIPFIVFFCHQLATTNRSGSVYSDICSVIIILIDLAALIALTVLDASTRW